MTIPSADNIINCIPWQMGPSDLWFPNVHCLLGEQDLLQVTRAGYPVEWEVKRTVSDFRADARKVVKFWSPYVPTGLTKHDLLSGKASHPRAQIPRRFWFAAPIGIIPVEELPEWAGLAEIDTENHMRLTVVTKAPIIANARKLSVAEFRRLYRSTYHRYWNERRRQWNES